MKVPCSTLGALAWFVMVGCGGSPSGAKTAATPPPQEPQAATQPIPSDLRSAIEHAEEMGLDIYLQDKASAIGTDALLARVGSIDGLQLGGFLTLREGDASGRPSTSPAVYQVIFFTQEQPPRIAFRVHVPFDEAAKPTVDEIKPRAPASSGELLLITGRQTAIAALREVVQPINPVVLPAGRGPDDGILVYLLAGTKRPNVAVFGRHYRVLVSSDGRTVKKFEPLSKGILEVAAKPPPGATATGLVVSHLVTDYPLETHVFTSLLHRVPVYVATSRGNWQVDGRHITFLGARQE